MVTLKKKAPWPTRAVMEQIYRDKLWGDNGDSFYSGIGSHHPELVEPYIKAVSTFLTSFKIPLTVCDLGCGDFNIGKELVAFTDKYIAVDIVPELILNHKRKFKYSNVEFQCLDIAKDNLPNADCAILRQVVQHLSNAEVKKITEKLYIYKYVLLTEHLPEGGYEPNSDIISGQGIRLKKHSGLDLLEAPFHLKVKGKNQLLSLDPLGHQGRIVTTLLQMF
ncbi:MAG: class I SAM-dependent methyltransferase [Bacteroidota bacterium]